MYFLLFPQYVHFEAWIKWQSHFSNPIYLTGIDLKILDFYFLDTALIMPLIGGQ